MPPEHLQISPFKGIGTILHKPRPSACSPWDVIIQCQAALLFHTVTRSWGDGGWSGGGGGGGKSKVGLPVGEAVVVVVTLVHMSSMSFCLTL